MNNQNKKILIVITKSNFGGAQKYVFELAKSLKKQNLDVFVALGGSGALLQKLEAENIPVTSLPSLQRDISLSNDLKSSIDLFKLIKKIKPDVVHLNSSKIGAIGSVVSRIARVPKIIFTIHGWAFNEDRSFVSKFILYVIYSIAIFFSHSSIAVSKMTANQAKKLPLYFLLKNKIHVVLNGIEIPNFQPKEDARNFLSDTCKMDFSSKKIIGQIAELHPIKSIETTVYGAQTLVQENPDLVFVIMGDGELKESLTDLIKKLGLEDKVFLTGYVDNAAQYIKAFDVFVLTSKSEALALVLLEAGLAEVPVIAPRVGGVPEIIEDHHTGLLFESGNTKEFVSKVNYILTTHDFEKETMIKNFYTNIQNNFLIEHMTAQTIKHY